MTTDMTYAEFEQLVSVYGSEPARWPVDARARAARLVGRSAQAQQLLQETEALDQLLAKAPRLALAREADLASRIVMAAQRTPRVVAAQPRELAVGSIAAERAREDVATAALPASVTRLPLPRRGKGRSRGLAFAMADRFVGVGAAVSAAALVMGVLLGFTNLAQPVLRPLQQMTGLPVAGTSASVGAVGDISDEDYL